MALLVKTFKGMSQGLKDELEKMVHIYLDDHWIIGVYEERLFIIF